MSDDDLALALLLLGPIATALVTYGLFGVARLHTRRGFEIGGLLLGNALGLALCLSLLAAMGELYFRFVYDTTDAFAVTKTTQRWLERHYRLNEAGMRDDVPSYPAARSPGHRRVTFLGDSFTAGFGVNDVEDRFANRVRSRRPDWEIHVLADNGWNTGAHLEMLAQHPEYEIDRLVLVYGLNDISDIDARWEEMRDGLYDEARPTSLLAGHSFLFNRLHYRGLMWRNRSLSEYFRFNRDAYEIGLWKQQRSRLVEIHRLVRAKGGQLLVVTFPFVHAIGPDYAYRDVHKKLSRFWSSIGVPHLDLLPVFDGANPDDLVVNSDDTHPNVRAHGIAADALLPFLDAHLGGDS